MKDRTSERVAIGKEKSRYWKRKNNLNVWMRQFKIRVKKNNKEIKMRELKKRWSKKKKKENTDWTYAI